MQQKRLLTLSSCLLLATLMISGCDTKNTAPQPDLFQYKNAYVGNSTAVGSILNGLPVTGYSKDFELVTQQRPYGIILNYDGSESPQQQPQIVVYTATYLFALIQNVDWIRYNFANRELTITKEQMQQWYGEDLSRIQNEDELHTLIDKYINDQDKIKQLIQ
ncbi:DUF4825 domain-containing protein [Psychrobacter sp. I-STPA10]|uniref:DUF4825 domain-containing protein n=1 Tax=Psychrobacter sp. I-STPA10 TaxID=2585769 RepID=UPI001E56356E|nr:DUF4825 domain-containing protein [Psychrobacter sp. I-STPA10]